MDYTEFLASKAQLGGNFGFSPVFMPSCAFDFQASVAEYNILAGRSAAFLDCGLGKSLIELIWSENVVRYTNKPVLILTPLAVAQQFIREGQKFGIKVTRIAGGCPPKGENMLDSSGEQGYDSVQDAGVGRR